MRTDQTTRFLLLLIAVSLLVIALRLAAVPSPVMAQSGDVHAFYVEPGTFMLRAPDGTRQVMGKVMIDMRNGNIWGFPTLTQDPYPTAGANTTPPISRPFLLGKFALNDADK
jgi:hypothetical protein